MTHEYPNIGAEIGAVPVLRELVAAGHRLMLWTMRGNKPFPDGRNTLQEAADWFAKHDIPLWGVNENPEQKESGWSNSNKQYAQVYIDDAAIGCPLIYLYTEIPSGAVRNRPYVDWYGVRELLVKQGILPKLT